MIYDRHERQRAELGNGEGRTQHRLQERLRRNLPERVRIGSAGADFAQQPFGSLVGARDALGHP